MFDMDQRFGFPSQISTGVISHSCVCVGKMQFYEVLLHTCSAYLDPDAVLVIISVGRDS